MRKLSVLCSVLVLLLSTVFLTGCDPFKITVSPATIEVFVGANVPFNALKSSISGLVPYAEAVWTMEGDDVGSFSPPIGSTTIVKTDAPGTAIIKASAPDGTPYGTAILIVKYIQIATRMVVTPSTWYMNHGEVKSFTAVVYDQHDAAMAVSPTWTLRDGIVGYATFSPSSGLSSTLTALDPGTSPRIGKFRAAYNDLYAESTVTIDRQDPVLTTLSLSEATDFGIEKNMTKGLSVSGLDQYGVAFTSNPTWSATNSTGTFSPNPASSTTFTATGTGPFPKSGVIWAKQTNSKSVEISDSVPVTVNDYVPIPTRMTVAPSSWPSMKHGDNKSFTAVVYDQYDAAMAVSPTWTLRDGIVGYATFSPSSGLSSTLTALDPGASPRSGTFRASYSGLYAESTVTISRQNPVLTTLSISPSDGFNIVKGTTKAFSSSGLDQYGVPFTPSPTWSATNSTGTFSPNPSQNTTFTATTAGVPKSGVISASQGIIQSNTVSVTVDDVVQVPTRIAVIPPSGWTMVHGETKSFTATLYNQFDQAMPGVSFTWNASGGAGSCSPGPAPNTIFTAGDPGNSPDTISITASYGDITSPPSTGTVSRQARVLKTLSISPPDAFHIVKGNTKDFSSSGLDQYDEPFAPSPTWSATNSTGAFSPNPGQNTTFTATTTGVPKSGVISASQVNSLGSTIQSNTVAVTVDDVERIPTRIAIGQSSDWTMVDGDQKTFNAKLYDQFDVEMPAVSYTWDKSGGVGTFSPNPGTSTTFTAGDPGTSPDTISITAAYSGLTSPACTGTISRQASRPSSVVVAPSSLNIYGTDSTSFSAKVYNQYSAEMPGEPVIWSITGESIGTLTSSSANPTTFNAIDLAIGNPDRSGKIWAKAANNQSIADDTNVTVKATKTLDNVTVSLSPVNMNTKTKTITATAYDQYGNTFSADSWFLRSISNNSYVHATAALDSTGTGSTRQILITVTEAIIGGDGTWTVEVVAKKSIREIPERFIINTPRSIVDVITLDTSSISGVLDTTSSTFNAKAWDQYGYFISATFSWTASNSVGSLQYSSSSGANKLTFKKAVTGSVIASAGGKTKSLSATGIAITGTFTKSNGTDYNIPDNGYSSGNWAVSTITVTELRSNAVITGAYLEYGVVHRYFTDLRAWGDVYRNGVWYETATRYPTGVYASPTEKVDAFNTTTFNGQLANGSWHMCVADEVAADAGYISYFYISFTWKVENTW